MFKCGISGVRKKRIGRKFKVKIFVVKEKLKLGKNIQVVSNFVWALC